MTAGQNTKMLRGAIWACVIPVGPGIVGLISLVAGAVKWADRTDYSDVVLILSPIIVVFILGPPLTAWLACRSLAKVDTAEKLSRWKSSATRGMLYASLVHFISATLYTVGALNLIHINNRGFFPEADPDYSVMGAVMINSAIINFALWLIITLPLALLCATIFWKVTKFPDDTSVF